MFIVLSLTIPDELPPRVVIGDGGDVVWGCIGVIHEKGKKREIIIREREREGVKMAIGHLCLRRFTNDVINLDREKLY